LKPRVVFLATRMNCRWRPAVPGGYRYMFQPKHVTSTAGHTGPLRRVLG
jgi:hypothetical protein